MEVSCSFKTELVWTTTFKPSAVFIKIWTFIFSVVKKFPEPAGFLSRLDEMHNQLKYFWPSYILTWWPIHILSPNIIQVMACIKLQVYLFIIVTDLLFYILKDVNAPWKYHKLVFTALHVSRRQHCVNNLFTTIKTKIVHVLQKIM